MTSPGSPWSRASRWSCSRSRDDLAMRMVRFRRVTSVRSREIPRILCCIGFPLVMAACVSDVPVSKHGQIRVPVRIMLNYMLKATFLNTYTCNS